MEIQKISSLADLHCLIENQDIVNVNGIPQLYRGMSCERFSFTRRIESEGAIGVMSIKSENLRFDQGGIKTSTFFPDFYYNDTHPKVFAREAALLRTAGL